MAWTTPHTYTVGEVLSASTMNVNVRDNTNALKQLKVEHPYGDNRHVEAGQFSIGTLASNAVSAQQTGTFADPFVNGPYVVLTAVQATDSGSNTNGTSAPIVAWLNSVSTTAFTAYVRNTSNGSIASILLHWIAFGGD